MTAPPRLVLLTLVLFASSCGDPPPRDIGPMRPHPIAWGMTKCDSCRMSIGSAPFSAQCRTVDGTVLFFDDPGCLALELECRRIQSNELLFHHLEEDRWLPESAASFVPHDETPMDFGFAAVEAGRRGGVPFADVRAAMNRQFLKAK